jgi:hypothetical protein
LVARLPLALAASSLLTACAPTVSDDTSVVTSSRLLAVQAVPADVATGGTFALTALYVGPRGGEDPSSIDWAICLLQKPLGEPGPIDPACFVGASPSLLPLGTGGAVHASVPSNACELFGPDSPPPQPGQPAARPTDPDTTGGFYLPIRLRTGDADWAVALERIECQPSGVSLPVFSAFTDGYVANENPTIGSLSMLYGSGAPVPIPPNSPAGPPGLSVSPGRHVSLQVEWPECSPVPASCGGAETYLYIDPTTKEIATGRESIVASFYATGGSFDLDRVGRSDDDTATHVTNGWTAPTSPGEVRLWVVLRDSRGGVGWGSYAVEVKM